MGNGKWEGHWDAEQINDPSGKVYGLWIRADVRKLIDRLNALQAVAEAAKDVASRGKPISSLRQWGEAMQNLRTALAGLEGK